MLQYNWGQNIIKSSAVYFNRYREFSHEVTAAILRFQNNEMAALMYKANPVEVKLFSHVNAFICSNNYAGQVSENILFCNWTNLGAQAYWVACTVPWTFYYVNTHHLTIHIRLS